MPSRPSGEKADLWAGGAVTRPHSQLAGVTAGVGPAVSDFKADLFSALWTDPHFPCSLGCRCSSYSSGREHETWISTRRLRAARTGRPSRTRGAPGRGTKPRCLGAQKVRPHLGAGGWGPAEPWKGTGSSWGPHQLWPCLPLLSPNKQQSHISLRVQVLYVGAQGSAAPWSAHSRASLGLRDVARDNVKKSSYM